MAKMTLDVQAHGYRFLFQSARTVIRLNGV